MPKKRFTTEEIIHKLREAEVRELPYKRVQTQTAGISGDLGLHPQ